MNGSIAMRARIASVETKTPATAATTATSLKTVKARARFGLPETIGGGAGIAPIS
jgi:hypothetical protein